MHWLNLHTPSLRCPEFVGSEPAARATWLCVNAYCCEQENSGRIIGARVWKDRQWQQTCGVTLAEVEASAPLLEWSENDLVVWNYPQDKQAEIKAKRKAGKRGGKQRAATASTSWRSTPVSTASSSDSSRASTERKGKEEKGIEGNTAQARGVLRFPVALSEEKFKAKFAQWEKTRRAIGRKPKDWAVMFQEQLDWLEGFGPGTAFEILSQSIRNNWQGLFELKSTGNGSHPPVNKSLPRPDEQPTP